MYVHVNVREIILSLTLNINSLNPLQTPDLHNFLLLKSSVDGCVSSVNKYTHIKSRFAQTKNHSQTKFTC